MSSSTSSAEGSATSISCPVCGCNFAKKFNLRRHMIRFHRSEVSISQNKLCGVCGESFENDVDLQIHMDIAHPTVKLVMEKKTFYCMEDFEAWKRDIEIKTQSHFIKKQSDHKLANGKTAMYFSCHRTGNYKSKAENESERKRRLKTMGSNKIGKKCPACITVHQQVVDEAMELEVQYQSTHIGHKMEVGRLPIPDSELTVLAGQMALGVPKSRVLANLRTTFSPTKRLSLTTKKDLHNICHGFKIDAEVIFDKEDDKSVHMRVQEMMNEEDNPILIYKPINTELSDYPLIKKEEYLLGIMNNAQLRELELNGEVVMIDSTHGTNQYGFQLTSLMVNDSNHEGFPVAILYSTRTATETFIPFFQKIKDRCPNLKPLVFMSDDAPAFYNAWKTVFGEVQHNLLCAWHVTHSWNSNLNTKIKDRELRESTKQKIKALLYEIDYNTFTRMAAIYIPEILACEETKAFGEYFCSHYMNRTEMWAYCHRVKCQVNTNMKLERWHRTIKHEEGNAKIIRRLDRSLCHVLSAISTKLIGRIISLERGKLTSRMSEIRKRHDRSMQMSRDKITEIVDKKHWAVRSSKTETDDMLLFMYDVKYEADCDCNIRCLDCHICIHQFSCTCPDYCIRFMICKHIHLVCRHFDLGSLTLQSNDMNDLAIDVTEREVIQQEEHAAICKELKKSSTVSSTENEKAEILSMFMQILENNDGAEEIKDIKQTVIALKARTDAAKAARARMLPNVINKQPANKNIEPQRRMFSRLKLKRKNPS